MKVARHQRGNREIVKHLGSAHDAASLALLEAKTDEVIAEMLGAEQLAFELEGIGEEGPAGQQNRQVPRIKTVGTNSGPLWNVLSGVYDQIFGTVIDSPVFKHLVIARIMEPSSKADAIRVIEEAGVVAAPSLRTLWRHLGRHKDQQWRDAACQAAYRFAVADAGGPGLSVVLYDATTLYWEADEEDETRK